VVVQSGAIDAQAMTMALAACLVPPLARLNRHKPSDRMCTWRALALLALMAFGLAMLDLSYMALLLTRPWFKGGTGNAYKVSVAYPLAVLCLLCRAELSCAVLCCAVLCCAVLCCAVLCCAVLCCAVLCCAVLCLAWW